MKKDNLFGRVLGSMVVLSLIVGLFAALPAQAATYDHVRCVRHKVIQQWNNQAQLMAHGFFVETAGDEGTLDFVRRRHNSFLSLDVATTSDFIGQYIASRITEIDTSVPVAQRTKCWQPTFRNDVVAEFQVRFEQSETPSLTEDVMLWNAPFGDNPIPLTAIGVTRSPGSGGQYAAIIAQDLVFNPDFSYSGDLTIVPMPSWLDATQWHSVRIRVSQTHAQIEVAQGRHRYTLVTRTPLAHAPEPLGFEFSLDNEIVPGYYGPVAAPDSLDVDYFDIRIRH